MFAGHYGPGYGARAVGQRVPLWVLFLAVQFLDVLWGVFVLLGIEKVRIVPGITATNPLDLYYMPYTHSLAGALFWSLVAGLIYGGWRRGRAASGRGAWVVGGAVFSHWVLDLLVHRPDLPLWANRFKVGLGLWNYPVPAFALEALFLFGGLWIYLRATRAPDAGGAAGFIVLSLLLLGLQLMTFFGSPPPTPAAAAITALGSYAAIATAAGWLDARRNHPARDAGSGARSTKEVGV